MGGDAPEPAVAAPRLAGGRPPVPGAALGLVTERFKTANLEANELLEEAVLILPIIVAPAPRGGNRDDPRYPWRSRISLFPGCSLASILSELMA